MQGNCRYIKTKATPHHKPEAPSSPRRLIKNKKQRQVHVLTTNVSHGEGNPRGSKVHAPNLHNREKNLLRINKIGPPRHFHLRACTCLRSTTNTPESLGSRVIRPPPRPAFRPCFRFPAPPSRKSAKAVLAHKWPPPPPREKKGGRGWTEWPRFTSEEWTKSRGARVPGEGGRVAPGVVPPHDEPRVVPTQQPPPPRRNQPAAAKMEPQTQTQVCYYCCAELLGMTKVGARRQPRQTRYGLTRIPTKSQLILFFICLLIFFRRILCANGTYSSLKK